MSWLAWPGSPIELSRLIFDLDVPTAAMVSFCTAAARAIVREIEAS